MVWRRFLIRDDSTIADLHYIIQIAMEWEDYYLHNFTIHGKTLGISRAGGEIFFKDADEVFLKDFQFYINERFLYKYNFFDNWELEIRLEKTLSLNPKTIYPCCIGGKRAPPPENCGGPKAFMELQDYYSPWRIEEKLLSLVRHKLHMSNDSGNEDDDEYYDKEYLDDNAESIFETLKYWIKRHELSCRTINHRLEEHFKNKEQCRKYTLEGTYED